jgi:hypothetical protein
MFASMRACASGLIAGILWTRISPAAPFASGAAVAALALIGLAFVPRMAIAEEG